MSPVRTFITITAIFLSGVLIAGCSDYGPDRISPDNSEPTDRVTPYDASAPMRPIDSKETIAVLMSLLQSGTYRGNIADGSTCLAVVDASANSVSVTLYLYVDKSADVVTLIFALTPGSSVFPFYSSSSRLRYNLHLGEEVPNSERLGETTVGLVSSLSLRHDDGMIKSIYVFNLPKGQAMSHANCIIGSFQPADPS